MYIRHPVNTRVWPTTSSRPLAILLCMFCVSAGGFPLSLIDFFRLPRCLTPSIHCHYPGPTPTSARGRTTLFNLYLVFHTFVPLFCIPFFLFLFGPGLAYILLIALDLHVRHTPTCLIQLLQSKRPKASSLRCSNRHEAWSRPNLSTARLPSTLCWRRSCCASWISV